MKQIAVTFDKNTSVIEFDKWIRNQVYAYKMKLIKDISIGTNIMFIYSMKD